jgi:hypothetical protein
MIFYMLWDKKTGLWYKRHHGRGGSYWVEQNEASVWTTPAGPRACLGPIRRDNRRITRAGYTATHIREPEIVSFQAGNPVTVGLVICDDWEGMYLNGKLVTEGHHIRLNEMLRHLGIKCIELHPDDTWLEEGPGLPEDFNEVS